MNTPPADRVAAVWPAQAQRTCLRVVLRGSPCCLPIAQVREIVQLSQMTPAPFMPEFVRGLINRRGEVVSVLDLGLRLGLGATPMGRRTCVVIVELACAEGAPQRHGVLVDAVHEVMDVTPEALRGVPTLGTRIDPRHVLAIVRSGVNSLEVLNLDSILDEQALDHLMADRVAQLSLALQDRGAI